jgi:hypothetical protein
LFSQSSLIMHLVLVSTLLLFNIDHRSVVLALFLCVSLVPRRLLVSERHGTIPLVLLLLAALNVAVAVVVYDLISVHKYQVRRVNLLNTLGKRLLLVSDLELVLVRTGTLCPLPSTHRGIASLEDAGIDAV